MMITMSVILRVREAVSTVMSMISRNGATCYSAVGVVVMPVAIVMPGVIFAAVCVQTRQRTGFCGANRVVRGL